MEKGDKEYIQYLEAVVILLSKWYVDTHNMLLQEWREHKSEAFKKMLKIQGVQNSININRFSQTELPHTDIARDILKLSHIDLPDNCPENEALQKFCERLIADAQGKPTEEEAGEWVLEYQDGKPYCYHCSNCDSDNHYIGIIWASDYCPNCGKQMKPYQENERNIIHNP